MFTHGLALVFALMVATTTTLAFPPAPVTYLRQEFTFPGGELFTTTLSSTDGSTCETVFLFFSLYFVRANCDAGYVEIYNDAGCTSLDSNVTMGSIAQTGGETGMYCSTESPGTGIIPASMYDSNDCTGPKADFFLVLGSCFPYIYQIMITPITKNQMQIIGFESEMCTGNTAPFGMIYAGECQSGLVWGEYGVDLPSECDACVCPTDPAGPGPIRRRMSKMDKELAEWKEKVSAMEKEVEQLEHKKDTTKFLKAIQSALPEQYKGNMDRFF